jgi:hypothetical protein
MFNLLMARMVFEEVGGILRMSHAHPNGSSGGFALPTMTGSEYS